MEMPLPSRPPPCLIKHGCPSFPGLPCNPSLLNTEPSASLPQGTPEENVGLFCQLARDSGALFKQHGMSGKVLVGSK